MENAAAGAAVEAARFSRQFRRPLPDSYSFARLPATIEHLVTGEGPAGLPEGTLDGLGGDWQTVILLFVDGFGWELFCRHREALAALRRFDSDGMIARLTSQFPSTTAAQVTTLHSGLPVVRHAVVEWNYYEPTIDRVISPLPFKLADSRDGRDSLLSLGVDPAVLFEWETIYPRLAERGVETILYQPTAIANGAFSKRAHAGAVVRPYNGLDEALAALAGEASRPAGKRYFLLYYDGIDGAGHRYGPESEETAAEIARFWQAVDQNLIEPLAGHAGRTLLLATADHGQTTASVENPFYVNRKVPEIIPLLRRGSDEKVLAPGGSSADLLLYVEEGALDEAHGLLASALDGIGEAHRTMDLVREGFFGSPPFCASFMPRLGDLVALAYPGEAIWWHEPGVFEIRNRGHHGGLSPAEMDTMLLALPLA